MNSKFIRMAIGASVLITTIGSAAAENGWTNIGRSAKSKVEYDIRNGSFEIIEIKGNIKVLAVVGRINDTKTLNIEVFRWAVPLQACRDELGAVLSFNLSNEYLETNEFVFGGGNMAAAVGESICTIAVAEFYSKEMYKKGL